MKPCTILSIYARTKTNRLQQQFILNEMKAMLYGQRLFLTVFYGTYGAILSLFFSLFYAKLVKNMRLVQQMSEELAKDIHNVIAQGEGPNVEFKSSFRWVYHQGKANKAPDLSILKTIAGFMNFEGGNLAARH